MTEVTPILDVVCVRRNASVPVLMALARPFEGNSYVLYEGTYVEGKLEQVLNLVGRGSIRRTSASPVETTELIETTSGLLYLCKTENDTRMALDGNSLEVLSARLISLSSQTLAVSLK